MGTEIILALTALALSFYCLIYSVRQRGALYFPLPKGLPALGKSRRALYLLALCLAALSAAVSAAAALTTLPAALCLGCEGVFLIAFLAYLLRLTRRAPRGERLAGLGAFLAAVIGAVVEAVWSVRVAPFFGAVALFGCLLLLECDPDAPWQRAGKSFHGSMLLMAVVAFGAVIAMNVTLILKLTNAQSDELGNTQLNVIRSDLEDAITGAETGVLRVAIGAEQLMETDASREALAAYFDAQREKNLSNDSFMNVYIAGPDWHIVPAFDAPEGFHAAERVWYLGAKDTPGEVFITEPYLDADTGAMCFSVSTLLSDGETVVGMDLNFSKVQESIRRMTQGQDRTAMIVTSGGLIAGYTDMNLVGERADEKLPEYAEILRRVAASQEHGSFHVELDDGPAVIFSSETKNHWYLILSVDTGALYGESYRQMAMLGSVNLLMLAMLAVFWQLSVWKSRRAEETLAENAGHMAGFSARLRESAARLTHLGDVRMLGEGADAGVLAGEIGESGEQLSQLADDLAAYSGVLNARKTPAPSRARRGADASEAPSRKVRNGIIAALLVSLAIVLTFCVSISINWGDSRMNREADGYENQLGVWLTQQRSILYMFTDMISTQPELMDDYEAAVRWLNRLARHYPEISACYMANPYAAHPVIMNTGWEPGEEERPETRPWYRATERAQDGFNISAPYLDAQTGNYCITLSRVVYGEKGEFLGIFGVDFFLDKLIHVLGERYTSRSYAFLVDSDGVIVNHPNAAYQMGERSAVSVADTEYADACHREGVTALRDYAGRFMACLSRKTDSGFSVVVANRWWSIYGSVVFVTALFLVLFSLCLAFIVALINRLIRWQGDVNRQLVAAAESAESANRAKSQFLSQMSHEIRTPMNAIIGLNTLAMRDPEISPRTREQLEKIEGSARHLLSLINDILDMSRIESGRMTFQETEFAFRDFLDQISVMINGQCAEKGLRFEQKTAAELDADDVWFLGDELKLKQVLINILGNAVKFTEPPGVVSFAVEQLSRTDDDCVLRFTMRDSGIGMDEEFLPHIFEAFAQGEGAAVNRYGGTGLGMAITKNIVDMMGGRIEVESEKGVGSTFTVTLTLRRAQRAAAAPLPADDAAPAEPVTLAGRHVLIAEDMEMNAEILIDLLEMEDITVEWVENGRLAVDCFAASAPGSFDAILMDMRMPVMDGLEAAREIRRLDRPDAAQIPIIALTANAFEEDARQCLQAGMNAHLSKPVDIDRLMETMRALLAARLP